MHSVVCQLAANLDKKTLFQKGPIAKYRFGSWIIAWGVSLIFHIGVIANISRDHTRRARINLPTLAQHFPQRGVVYLALMQPTREAINRKYSSMQAMRVYRSQVSSDETIQKIVDCFQNPVLRLNSGQTAGEKRRLLAVNAHRSALNNEAVKSSRRSFESSPLLRKQSMKKAPSQPRSQYSTQVVQPQSFDWTRLIITAPLVYPQAAFQQRAQGSVTVQAKLNAQGKVYGVRMLQSSGNPSLDQAAYTWFQKLRIRSKSDYDAVAGVVLTQTIAFTIQSNMM